MADVAIERRAPECAGEMGRKPGPAGAPLPERIVSALLRYGVVISLAFVLAGGLWLLASAGEGHSLAVDPRSAPAQGTSHPWPTTIGGVLRDALAGDPDALILLGLLLLIATPVLRVVVSVLLFLAEGDRVYAGITLFVLGVLALSFVLGAAEG
ncbi:MAG: DUF1634 domain-containing protein [Anaerolineae bacterium]|nr:DUF1634 domain-containing protein [Anaerolineae bacterium]